MPPTPPALVIRGHRIPRIAVLAVLMAVAGLTTVTVVLGHQSHAPRPSQEAATAPLGPSSATSPATGADTGSSTPHRPGSLHPSVTGTRARRSLAPPAGDVTLGTSAPVALTIPAIGVSSTLMDLGLNPDGSAQVPPLSQVSIAGWYRYSATPGASGSAVVLGHIDSASYGAGVFYRLGSLRPGDEVDVRRADGRTAVFRVDRVAEYPKSAFPTRLVYAATRYSSLRLVTCGGTFDSATHNYLDNIIAFATLVSAR